MDVCGETISYRLKAIGSGQPIGEGGCDTRAARSAPELIAVVRVSRPDRAHPFLVEEPIETTQAQHISHDSGSNAARSKVEVRLSWLRRSRGRSFARSRPTRLLSPQTWRRAEPDRRDADLPAPQVIEGLRQNEASLSPSVLTGGRVFSVRERTKLLEVVKRGRSQDVSFGVSERWSSACDLVRRPPECRGETGVRRRPTGPACSSRGTPAGRAC